MSDSAPQQRPVPVSKAAIPRVPPPALRPPAPAQLAPPAMTTTGYRARALAKVSRAVQSTSEYVAPKLDSAQRSARDRLNELRDRHDSWEAERSSPSRSFSTSSSSSSVRGDYLDPVAAAAAQRRQGTRSSSTSTSSSTATEGQSKWGGWANYFSSNYRKDRDPSTYGEERIVSFPGVSAPSVASQRDTKIQLMSAALF